MENMTLGKRIQPFNDFGFLFNFLQLFNFSFSLFLDFSQPFNVFSTPFKQIAKPLTVSLKLFTICLFWLLNSKVLVVVFPFQITNVYWLFVLRFSR